MVDRVAAKILLSDKVTGAIIKGWQIGNAALAMLVLGAICIVMAFLLTLNKQDGIFVFSFLGFGAICVLFVAFEFWVRVIRPAMAAINQINDNKELLDKIQEATLQMTSIISQLNDMALIHANAVVGIVSTAKSKLKNIPIANLVLDMPAFQKPESFVTATRSIVSQSKTVISDVEESISMADTKRISEHVRALDELRRFIERELQKAATEKTRA